MKNIGLLLITIGFLAASFVAVQDHLQINWLWFTLTALIGLAGVAIARMATRAEAEHADTVASNIEDIDRSLRAIVEKVSTLNRDKEAINTYDMRHKIDEMLLDDLDTFVNARETIGTRYGLHAYADVMSHFAAGERYLNRVWSCSADGYIDEVNIYIARAAEQFSDTLQRFEELRTQQG
jgi:hypothetical protein